MSAAPTYASTAVAGAPWRRARQTLVDGPDGSERSGQRGYPGTKISQMDVIPARHHRHRAGQRVPVRGPPTTA